MASSLLSRCGAAHSFIAAKGKSRQRGVNRIPVPPNAYWRTGTGENWKSGQGCGEGWRNGQGSYGRGDVNFGPMIVQMGKQFVEMMERLEKEETFTPSTMFSYLTPRVRSSEEPTSYLLEIDIPGVPKENVHVEVTEDRMLTIKATRKQSERSESSLGNNLGGFTRSLCLPEDADVDAVSAKTSDGVLTITIGKKEKSKHGGRVVNVDAAP